MSAQMANIYNYQNPRQFVLDRVNTLQKQDSSLSIRQLATKMGFKSHTLLVMLLQGKRPFRVKHGTSLAQGLGLSSQERLYLQALIQYDSAQDLEEKRLCQLWLSELHPERDVRTRQLDQFEVVSNWIHMAIISLSETYDFDPSPEAIARRLGNRASVNEVRAALERLKSLGLIVFDDKGRFKPNQNRITTPDDVRNAGVRRYHREVSALAQEAIERVPLECREFQAFSISIPHSKVSLAKELVRKFRSQFAKAIGLEPGHEVFQMNIQLFQLTENPTRMVRAEGEGVDTEWMNPKQIGKNP